MGNKEIKVIFYADGKVKLDAEGFTGGSCKYVLEGVQKGLGETIDEQKKPEFYMNEEVHQEVLT